MEAELYGAVIGSATALVVTFFGVALQQRHNRARLTFDLQAEFNNSEFNHARSRASEVLTKHPDVTFQNMGEVLSQDDASAVWLVVQFYQKLWVGIEYKHLDRTAVPDLFGDIYFYWYLVHFQRMGLKEDVVTARRLIKLKEWLNHCADPERRLEWEQRITRRYGVPLTVRAVYPSEQAASTYLTSEASISESV